MDNLTHTLTGAIAAKFDQASRDPESAARRYRVFFWLMLASANVPDLDAVVGLFADPITTTQQHRGLSHSILFAPILALLPAAVYYWFSSVKEFKPLWGFAVVGVYLHILYDLVTSYGTQLLQPFSDERFALDWIFIIDPYFTFSLVLLLILGKVWKSRARAIGYAGVGFMAVYLILVAANHAWSISRITETTQLKHANGIASLPQPLSVFRWMGLVQQEGITERVLVSLLDGKIRRRLFVDSSNYFTDHALRTKPGTWMAGFSRFPHVVTEQHNDSILVKMYDLQFSFDEDLARDLGFESRRPPFSMDLWYTADSTLRRITFNGRPITELQ